MFDVNQIPDSLKTLRKKLGLSQDRFTKKYNISIGTFRNWEQGSRTPDTVSLNYLILISVMPEEVAGVIRDVA